MRGGKQQNPYKTEQNKTEKSALNIIFFLFLNAKPV